jgi:hypothetical protein
VDAVGAVERVRHRVGTCAGEGRAHETGVDGARDRRTGPASDGVPRRACGSGSGTTGPATPIPRACWPTTCRQPTTWPS